MLVKWDDLTLEEKIAQLEKELSYPVKPGFINEKRRAIKERGLKELMELREKAG